MNIKLGKEEIVRLKKFATTVFAKYAGLKIERIHSSRIPSDIDNDAVGIIRKVQPFTMTPPERIFAVIQATRYATNAKIPGAVVECGVWRGGSVMAAISVLIQNKDFERDVYLFDTFEGMPAPSPVDKKPDGSVYAADEFRRRQTGADSSDWCYSPLDEVRGNVLSLSYKESHVHFIKGKTQETVALKAPETIAILRLDTDWYESTRAELQYLYPRLSLGGVLIIDDYGAWDGARKAVDEYFSEHGIPVLLHRVDGTCRVMIKQVEVLPSR